MLYSTKIRRIEHRIDLDPDFGDLQPDFVDAFHIAVIPSKISNVKGRYEFIALMPETECEEDSYALLKDVMEEFLPRGDKYTVREFTDDKVEEYIGNGSHGPIISFDPDSLEGGKIAFLWLVPPKHLMQ